MKIARLANNLPHTIKLCDKITVRICKILIILKYEKHTLAQNNCQMALHYIGYDHCFLG